MSSSRPYLVLLKGGPTHDINDHLSYHAEILSKSFDGEIWTFGSSSADVTIGNFRIRCIKTAAPQGMAAVRELGGIVTADVLLRADRLRGRRLAVTTYEPLVQPFYGYRLARKLGGKLIIEFPGTYKDKDNFADISSEWKRRVKYHQQQVLAQFWVTMADAVRVHFPGQNEGFIRIPASKPTSYYFDAIRLSRFEAADVTPEKYVLLVGHPYRRKGVDLLVEAWQSLADRFPDWRLVLIGFELDRHLPAEVAGHRQIQFVKPMPNAELAPWIKRSSILAVPSRSDTMPRVLMEAGAAGRARVASRVGGMPFMMTDEMDGLYVPHEDVPALRGALERLMSNEALRRRIGDAGRASVHERFSGERYCDDLLACVNGLYGEGDRTRGAPEESGFGRSRTVSAPSG